MSGGAGETRARGDPAPQRGGVVRVELDLRPLANGAAPVLGLIYHRPTRLTLARTVRRLFEHDPPADRLVLVLVEPAQTAELDAVLHRVCPQIQIDWLDSVRTKEHDGTH